MRQRSCHSFVSLFLNMHLFLKTFVAVALVALGMIAAIPLHAQTQIYHGDGAANNGSGGWTTSKATPDQCLSCHQTGGPAADMSSYLMTGHKNVLRKVTPGAPWLGADGTGYATTDSTDNYIYGSGSVYNWATGKVTVGPSTTSTAFGPIADVIPGNDSNGTYAFWDQPRTLYYQFGGWSDKTQLDTIFANGFTGEQFPNGNYDCARCHTTGYRFDSTDPTATEPKDYLGNPIPGANFSRVPTDYDPASGQTASWHQDGVQCERCHNADNGSYNHTAGGIIAGGIPTKPQNQNGTAICIQCHREETADTTANNIAPGNGTPGNYLFAGGGYCSDSTSLTALDCQNAGGSWATPWFDHESGPTFLNGPHARFSGTLSQNTQNSPDLSVNMTGTYSSAFSPKPTDNTQNSGCLTCHDVHQSLTQTAATPLKKNCNDCHSLSTNILQTIAHPTGPGTPFPTGTSADIPGACVTCHISQNYHLLRISTDPNYRTFPTPTELYSGTSTPHTAPETTASGTFANAVWSDVDLACGQCHVGGDGVTNPYGLTPPAASSYARVFSKAQLADIAANGYMDHYGSGPIHPGDPSAATPSFTPTPGTYPASQSVNLTDNTPGVNIYYTTDGSTPNTGSSVYSGTAIPVTATTTIKAIAYMSQALTSGGYGVSPVASGTYTINMPPASAPTFSPSPWTFTAPQSVTLADKTTGVTIYYTTDGSMPTTASTQYTGPFTVSTTTTIKSIAAGGGYAASSVSSGTYSFTAATPTFSPGPFGSSNTPTQVTLADRTSGVTIYYTTDGSTPTTASTKYAGPFTVSTTTTIKAIAAGVGYGASAVASGTYTITAYGPTFSPGPFGSFNAPTAVTLTDRSPGVTIYYTTDGSAPTTASTQYTGPFTVSTTTTVKSIAVGGGYGASTVASGTYTITAFAPTFSPGPFGTFSAPQPVTLTDRSPGVTIYYTTDGSTPTTASTQYTGPITVSTTTTVKSIAVGGGYGASTVASGTYTIK